MCKAVVQLDYLNVMRFSQYGTNAARAQPKRDLPACKIGFSLAKKGQQRLLEIGGL